MKKKAPEAEKENSERWLLTYSDMITLLLALFIVLYAISTVDKEKYNAIAAGFGEALGNGAGSGSQNGGGGKSDGDGESLNFGQLFSIFLQNADNPAISGIAIGEGQIKFTLSGDLIFAPNSAVLSSVGKDALDFFLPSIKVMTPYINKIEIDGHTSLATNPIVNDWDLSSDRAKVVLKYMEGKEFSEKDRFMMSAFGPHEPIDGVDPTAAANRRVELTITRNAVELDNTQLLFDILQYDYNQQFTLLGTDGKPLDRIYGADAKSAAQAIMDGINQKYAESPNVPSSESVTGEGSGIEVAEN
jgi:chemotaxis protein MotB